MAQPGQDAKFFTRGKIEVRTKYSPSASQWPLNLHPSGISCRTSSSGDEGQEICQAKDSVEEDRRKYYHGKR